MEVPKMRVKITLACTGANSLTTTPEEQKNGPDRLEMKKYAASAKSIPFTADEIETRTCNMADKAEKKSRGFFAGAPLRRHHAKFSAIP